MIKTKVFARMKPHHKKEIIQALQFLNKCVMMVGDGANDCVLFCCLFKSAISQAQVGVSFSASDASYTAPFSSHDDQLDSVVTILNEGKSTISILIEIFQYYVLTSVLKFAATLCLSIRAQNFCICSSFYLLADF